MNILLEADSRSTVCSDDACAARASDACETRAAGRPKDGARASRVPARLMRDKVHAFGEKLKGYENTGAPWRMQTHFPASTRTIRISKGGWSG